MLASSLILPPQSPTPIFSVIDLSNIVRPTLQQLSFLSYCNVALDMAVLIIVWLKVDARNCVNGEIIFKDNFSQAVAGIVEVCVVTLNLSLFVCCGVHHMLSSSHVLLTSGLQHCFVNYYHWRYFFTAFIRHLKACFIRTVISLRP